MSSYIPIASQTLASSASSVTFSSIPTTLNGKTLRDLVLVIEGTGTSDSNYGLRFNNDSGTNYGVVQMRGAFGNAASGAGDYTHTFLSLGGLDFGSGRSVAISQIFDYAQTNKHKSVLGRTNRADVGVSATAARWANTAAITRVDAVNISSTFAAGTTFNLYGIEG